MLTELSGREHIVITGYALVMCDPKAEIISEIADAVESKVVFKEISKDEIEWYIEDNEAYDKAGAYALQGKAAVFIKEIRGSHTNVIGLPLCEVVEALRKAGVAKIC